MSTASLTADVPGHAFEPAAPLPATSVTPVERQDQETGDGAPRGWLLTPAELAATREKIAKINDRAVRRGFTGRLSVDAVREEISQVNPAGLTVTEIRYRTQVTGQAPSYGDWSLLAVLDWDKHAGLIVRTAPGVDTIDRSTLRQGWCAHCQTVRHRSKTYLVGNATGETMQVGSTCLKDFLGWDGSVVFLAADDIAEEVAGALSGFGGGRRSFTTLTVLAAAWAVIKKDGFVPSRQRGATVDGVWTLISPFTSADRKRAAAFAPYVANAADMARQVRDWVVSEEFTGESEYVTNLKAVCAAEEVSPANIGLLVSAPQAWARAQEQSLIREREKDTTRNEFYSEPDAKVTVRVRVKSVRWPETRFPTTLYTLVSEDGYVFKWFASKDKLGDKPTTDFVTLRAIVKGHDEWQGFKSTVLTRCTVVEQS